MGCRSTRSRSASVRPDGDLRSIMVSIAFADESGQRFSGTIEDVTELAASAEVHAREAEAWRYVVDALPTRAYISRRGHGPEYVNAAAGALFGADEQQLLGTGGARSPIRTTTTPSSARSRSRTQRAPPSPRSPSASSGPTAASAPSCCQLIGDRQRSISTGIIADITDAEAERAVTERETARWRSMLDALPIEAIAALTADPQGFDLVLTDLTMPGVPGDELWRAPDAIRPGIPTVIVSGHAAEDVVDRVGSSGTVTFLHKPWSIAELHAAISRVVGDG